MKNQLSAIALAATLVMTGFASAKNAGEKPLRGKITEVTKDPKIANALDLTLTVGGKKNPHTVTVVVDETAQITLDGAAAKLTDLAEGERVQITPSTGTPKTITAITKGHKFGETAGGPGTQPSTPTTQPTAAAAK